MSRWALIPIKGFDRGKSRLSEVLAPDERARLARSLFEHVVQVLRDCPDIDSIAAVSDSSEARAHAERLGVVALRDVEESRGLADVVDAAVQTLALRGAGSVVICMSDLPSLTVDDVASVTQELQSADVVLVPDLARRGTNVIAVKPATALPSCLGNDDSLERHRALAEELGLQVSVQLRDGIGFDVDRPADLDRLQSL
jgi:2-phospho-L-lactate guanylyltransferase